MGKQVMNRNFLLLPAHYISRTVSVFFCTLILSLTACTEDPEIFPVLNTLDAESADITETTALLKGEIKTLGNMHIIEYGIEISKNMLFSPSVISGYSTPAEKGIFQVEFSGLDANTLYYYKAYATVNTAQIYSDNRLHFTTKATSGILIQDLF